MASQQTGVFIVRVWVEAGSERPLRAHVRRTTDAARGFDEATTLSEEEELVGILRAWVREMLSQEPPDQARPGY